MGQKLKYQKDHGGREKYVRVDRKRDLAGDCVVRSIAIALDKDYKTVYAGLCLTGLELCRMPNDPETFELYLNRMGWVKHKPRRDSNGRLFELRDFPAEEGERYIISTRGHLTCIVDRVVHDIWWCGEYRANSYFTKEK